jgi:RNA polymerase sigma-70 factor (ECF subfamily)
MSGVDPERWVAEHGDCLYRYALLRVREPAVAEDLVQETFLAAIKGRDRFAGQSAERSWLVGILKHKIIDHIRKRVREHPVEDVAELPRPVEEQFDPHGYWRHDEGFGPKEWHTDDPTVLVQQKEFWQQLDDCLAHLPPRTAEAFIMREMDGTSGEEICQVLGISSTNFWVMLHRARLQLRQCLENNWFEKGQK